MARCLLALTNYELALVQEGVHGCYISHCPRQNVRNMEAVEGGMRVCMQTGEVKIRMQEENARQCVSVWQNV